MKRLRISPQQLSILTLAARSRFWMNKADVYEVLLGMPQRWHRRRGHGATRMPDSAKASSHRSLVKLVARGWLSKRNHASHEAKAYFLTEAGKIFLKERGVETGPAASSLSAEEKQSRPMPNG